MIDMLEMLEPDNAAKSKLIGFLYCLVVDGENNNEVTAHFEGPVGGMKLVEITKSDLYKTNGVVDAALDSLMTCNIQLYNEYNEDEEGFTNWIDEAMNKYGYEYYVMADILEVWVTNKGDFCFTWL